MINFRYHVVSLTAVFLALAIGLVVGTAALNGPVADALNDQVNALGKDNKQLRQQLEDLKVEVNREEDFVSAAAPYILGGKLAGRRIVVVSVPSGQEYVDGIVKDLSLAGATVTGQVNLQDKFTNPANGVELLDLADRALPANLSSAGLPANSDGVETSSALLAAMLLKRAPQVSPAVRNSVLDAYAKAGYLSVTDKINMLADGVVFVTGQPYVDRDASAKNDAVVTSIVQFDNAGPIVVAGSDAGDGNAVGAVRADPALSKTISTVDNAATKQGQVVTALAMDEQLTTATAGHYGLSNGATALMPKQLE